MGKASFERMKSFRSICRRQEESGIRRRLVRVLLLFDKDYNIELLQRKFMFPESKANEA